MFLLDAESGLLECRICKGPVNLSGLRLSREQGVVGRAVSENAVQLVRDAQTDPRVHLRVDAETGFVTRSILCAPLATAGDSKPAEPPMPTVSALLMIWLYTLCRSRRLRPWRMLVIIGVMPWRNGLRRMNSLR